LQRKLEKNRPPPLSLRQQTGYLDSASAENMRSPPQRTPNSTLCHLWYRR